MTDVATRVIPRALILPFLKAREGCKLRAYQDSAGIWTCGYGSTAGVGPSTVWTQEQADDALLVDLVTAAERLEAKIGRPAVDRLSDHQYAAMLSFVFNLGTPGAGIWKLLKAGALEGVPGEMMRFVKARDPASGELVTLKGLTNRRVAEVALWSDADDTAPPPSSVTRAIETPAAVIPQEAHKSGSFVAVASAAVLGAPAAIKQVSDTVAPFADKSHYVEHLVGWLATGSAGAAVAGLVLLWMRRHAKAHG